MRIIYGTSNQDGDWKEGALHYELVLACIVFIWGRFCCKRYPSLCRGYDGTPLSKSLCQTARPRALLCNGHVVWGFFYAVVGYLLVAHVGAFDLRATSHILAFGLGGFSAASFRARHFGQFHGTNMPSRT
jgi:hypothetical protein